MRTLHHDILDTANTQRKQSRYADKSSRNMACKERKQIAKLGCNIITYETGL